MSDELKLCPFHKVDNWLQDDDDMEHDPYTMVYEGFWYVECTCGARGPISPTENYAIEAWNERYER